MCHKMKIGVLSLAIGEQYKQAVKYGIRTKEMYAKKHNYKFIQDETIYDSSRPIPWSKILLIQKYLPEFDYVLWMDADTMIQDLEIKLEDIITSQSKFSCISPTLTDETKDFLVCRDNGNCINTGVWFIKNTEYSKMILQDIWNDKKNINSRYFEQTSFQNFVETNHKNLAEHTIILENYQQHLFNCSIHFYKIGMFICHCLGINNLNTLKFVMNNLYQYQEDEETKDFYEFRMKKIKEEYY